MGQYWVFGYGSLIWRPDFRFMESHIGCISGWSRRFWQGSPDHRGTPARPGRVVTLIVAPGQRCWGRLFRLDPGDAQEIFRRLDFRERGGYNRVIEDAELLDGRSVSSLTYVASPDNLNYLGPASLTTVADRVRSAVGPSGTNRDYALRLAEAIRGMGQSDSHVFELVALLV